jgi:general secretion pathway protein A
MYEAFYGLREKPFSILPDPDLIYWGGNHRLAFAMLEFGVMNSAGFTVITGEIGSGKTTLLRYLLRRIDPKIVVGLISNTPRGTDGIR